MPPKPWILTASREEAAYPIFNLRIDQARSPRTNRLHDFYVLESPDWVNVIPLTANDEVVLIRQYRHGLREVTLEIPGGLVEDSDSSMEAARRELREETGYEAAELILLGCVHPNPAFLNNQCMTYLAKDVFPVGEQEQDDKEDIEVLLKPLEAIPDLIRDRQITHSLILAAFYRFYMEYLPGLSR